MEDSEIVDLYWDRDEAAISHTQEKYDRYLTKIAWNILANAEDSRESVNDTYLAAWNSMPPHRPGVLSTYLGKITRRISIDCFRGRNRDKRRGSQYALSLEELGECLRLQSPRARTAFLARYYYLDSLKEVAAACGMTESQTKSLLYRTRMGLKEYLRKEGFDL